MRTAPPVIVETPNLIKQCRRQVVNHAVLTCSAHTSGSTELVHQSVGVGMAGAAHGSAPSLGARDGRGNGQERRTTSSRSVKQLAKACAAATAKVCRTCAIELQGSLLPAHLHQPSTASCVHAWACFWIKQQVVQPATRHMWPATAGAASIGHPAWPALSQISALTWQHRAMPCMCGLSMECRGSG